MIGFGNQLLLSLAEARLATGDLEQCRGILLRMPPAERPKLLFEDVTYRLAKERLAAGRFEPARELFAECTKSNSSQVIRLLSQERSELLNRLMSRQVVSALQVKTLWEEAKVRNAERISPDMFTPEISFVGCPAAYRSGYDPQKIDSLSQLIRLMKHGVEEDAVKRVGQYLAAYLMYGTKVLETVDFVIPVPTQPERETLRGYSIPRLLADEVSKACALPIHDEFVRAAGSALELRHVPQWYRRIAIKGAFTVGKRAEWLDGLRALVIDDVITTGATLREVARLLRTNQVKDVFAVALAHTEWGGLR